MHSLVSSAALEFVFAIIGGVAYWLAKQNYRHEPDNDVFQLKRALNGHCVWGHRSKSWQSYLATVEQIGQVAALSSGIGRSTTVLVADPAAVRYLVKHIGDYPVLGHSAQGLPRLLTSRRPRLCPPPTDEVLKTLQTVAAKASRSAVNAMTSSRTISNHQFSKTDILDPVQKAVLDIVGQVYLGHDFGFGETREATAILTLWRQPGGAVPYELIEATEVLIMNIINRRRDLLAHETNEDEFLQLAMEAMERGDVVLSQVVEQFFRAILPAYEALSYAIAFTLHELSKNVLLQRRLREELRLLRAVHNPSPVFMPLLDAVCKETTRMYPPTGLPDLTATQNDCIPLEFPVISMLGEVLTSLKIKEGQILRICPLALNRNKTIWGGDAHEFNPDRWILSGRLPPTSCMNTGLDTLSSLSSREALIAHREIVLSLIESFEFVHAGENIEPLTGLILRLYVAGNNGAQQLPIYIKQVGY